RDARLADADDHALRARALDDRARGGVAIDEQLHLGRPRARNHEAPDNAGRRDHRHVGAQAVARALVDGQRAEIRRRRGADDLRGRRLQVDALAQLEQLAESRRAIRQRALLLRGDLDRRDLPLQLVVLDLEIAQPDVAVPDVANARYAARQAALHF